MSSIAAIGHLARDVVAEAEPRPGGGVFYAARALARLGKDARVWTACSADDTTTLVPPLEAFGYPIGWHESTATAAYSFHYEGERRIMSQDAVGDPWTPAQAVEAAGDSEWVDVGALVRTDFQSDTLAALARRGHRLLVDAQGLVRTATIGALETDSDIGDVLHHIEMLKLNDEEAETLVGSVAPEGLRALGVPEVILTAGSRGSWVVTPRLVEHVPAVEAEGPVDPTGAGDTYSATYLAMRAEGAEPVEAARAATATVSVFLTTP